MLQRCVRDEGNVAKAGPSAEPTLRGVDARHMPGICRFRRWHAWAAPQPDGSVVVGADEEFFRDPGEYVFGDLPHEGDEVVGGERFFATIYPWGLIQKRFHCPLTGVVVEVNHEMGQCGPWDNRKGPYGKEWLFRVAPAKPWEPAGSPARGTRERAVHARAKRGQRRTGRVERRKPW